MFCFQYGAVLSSDLKLASPPIRPMVQINFAKDTQIKHIYYTVKVGILF